MSVEPAVYDRRRWLQATACGFGSLAMGGIAHSAIGQNSGKPHFKPKASRVIFLFMQGGPSQIDLFDPKEYINERHGKPISSPLNRELLQVGTEKFLALGSGVPVRPRGESGTRISDLMPHLASIADDICLLRGMNADNPQHAPAELQFHTGSMNDVRPSMGSWISYGLGTENQNLPGFVTIHPQADVRYYGSAFLPASHQGTKITVDSNTPIENLNQVSPSLRIQRQRLDMVQRLNRRHLQSSTDQAGMQGMIEAMELAYRMQTTTPDLVDLSRESKSTLDLYGIGEQATDRNGRACLLARRMSEAGVRFVQVTMGGWDHHGNVRGNLPGSCRSSDQPAAALVKDLKSRGLLDETLILWSGEFGRTPWSQDLSGTSPIDVHGREHQPQSFCAWMAGGGIKPGLTYGETDEMGFHVTSGKIHVHDLHATILHQLGLDHTRLTWRHLGRDYRLTDVYGNVVKEILA
ncbi:MAG: DUF1501 domain-containing protein [bacterium]